jgi:hypothetical protein
VQLAFGLVERGDDVVAICAEERFGESSNTVALTVDCVGDDVEFSRDGGRVWAVGTSHGFNLLRRNLFRRSVRRSVACPCDSGP